MIGVSSGAAIGAVAALYFGWTALSGWLLPAAAFLGAMAAMAVGLAVSSMTRSRSTASLLLVGIAISALACRWRPLRPVAEATPAGTSGPRMRLTGTSRASAGETCTGDRESSHQE